MATKTATKTTEVKERPNRLLSSVIASSNARAKKDINQWRTALQQAENVDNPKRILLYNLYFEILLDSDLSADMEKRILEVLGTEFNLIDSTGKNDIEATKLLKKSWFTNLMRYAMESIFWGHSLVEIDALNETGEVVKVSLVPRRHIIPEKGIFTIKQGDEKGVLFREDKNVLPFTFEFGEKNNLGLLNKCAPHVLYMRFAQAGWSEFCEIFGMPVRYAKTNTKDKESLNRLQQMMIDMATASYAVIDKDETLEFIETAKSDGEVYNGLLKLCSAKLSKLILGSVIGEATDGGSRAKEQIGLQIQEKITKADKKWVEDLVNELILPKLIALGYPLADKTFAFEKTKDIEAEIKVATLALQHYEVPPKYFTDTFGVPVGQQKMNVAPIENDDPKTKAEGSNDFFA